MPQPERRTADYVAEVCNVIWTPEMGPGDQLERVPFRHIRRSGE
jgi:hypothetical protein